MLFNLSRINGPATLYVQSLYLPSLFLGSDEMTYELMSYLCCPHSARTEALALAIFEFKEWTTIFSFYFKISLFKIDCFVLVLL